MSPYVRRFGASITFGSIEKAYPIYFFESK